MMRTTWVLTLAALVAAVTQASVLHAQREVHPLDTDWKFSLEDSPKASAPVFNDSGWQTINVPHDWSFEAGVSEDGAQRDKGGYYSAGIGWYRTNFQLPALKSSVKTSIHFDGVYMNFEVWINGHSLGKFPYGYLSFSFDLTPHLKALKFPQTGSWNSGWKTLTVNFQLQAGANEITLISTGKGGPNIDALEIE